MLASPACTHSKRLELSTTHERCTGLDDAIQSRRDTESHADILDSRQLLESFGCELGDLGFSITGLEHMEPLPKVIEPPAVEIDPVEPVVVD